MAVPYNHIRAPLRHALVAVEYLDMTASSYMDGRSAEAIADLEWAITHISAAHDAAQAALEQLRGMK